MKDAKTPARCWIKTTFSFPVLLPSLFIIGSLLLFCIFYPQDLHSLFLQGQKWVGHYFDWLYTLAISIFLFFLLFLSFSRYGDIRLGQDHERPEFSFLSWSSMLFAAGMGIGLMYFGVGEPLQLFVNPQFAQAGTLAAAREAMLMTFFHWGFHVWAIYALMGLSLAYFSFRHQMPLTLHAGLNFLCGKRMPAWLKHTVDIFTLVATITGITTTLGYGVLQLGAGLNQLLPWDMNAQTLHIILITVIITLAGISAMTGVKKGVRLLSNINFALAIFLLIFTLLAGPTLFLLRAFSENTGHYLSKIIDLSLKTFIYQPESRAKWFSNQTILYWAWWISWSPFVGMFIARISKGRTVRQFIFGVLLLPCLFNMLWMTIFGNSAIWIDMNTAGVLTQFTHNIDAVLFHFFEHLPFTALLSWTAIALIALFFITSIDSGTLVLNALSSAGITKIPVWQYLFWALILGALAVLLLQAGGLETMRALTLMSAFPIIIVILLLCFSLAKAMAKDRPK